MKGDFVAVIEEIRTNKYIDKEENFMVINHKPLWRLFVEKYMNDVKIIDKKKHSRYYNLCEWESFSLLLREVSCE